MKESLLGPRHIMLPPLYFSTDKSKEEQVKRFHQDVKDMKRRYQERWNTGQYRTATRNYSDKLKHQNIER